MASSLVLERQEAAKQELARRIEEISQPEFIRCHIYESLPEYRGKGCSPATCRPLVVQNDGTGAATVEYQLESQCNVFAKLYTDDSGRHTYDVLRALWSNGFGRDNRYRVAEALAFFPQHNLLLVRGAQGTAVADARKEPELAAGAREAARWLILLHRSTIRLGEVRYP